MDTLKTAEGALKQAKADGDAYLAAIALGEEVGTTATDAEASVKQAANDLSIARITRDALAERAKHDAVEVERAQEAIDRAIGAVVRLEANVGRLLAEAQAVQADLVARRVKLRFLFNNNLVAEEEALRHFLLFQQHLPVGRGQAEYGNGHYDLHPAADPLKRALAALRENADAELPAS